MKNLIAFLLVFSLPFLLVAQKNTLDGFIKKYADKPGFQFLELKTNMFNMQEEEKTGSKSSHMVNLKILSFDETDKSANTAVNIYDEFINSIDKENYKGLVEVKSNGENVEMLVKKEGNLLTEVIITMREKSETTLMVASGNFDLSDMAKFGQLKNCKGFQTIEKLCED